MVPSRRSRALCRAIAACQLVTSAVAASNSVSISISSDSVPSDTSQYVDLAFGGFGIEPSNLFSFTGEEDQNDLSVNLLQNLANYTGEFHLDFFLALLVPLCIYVNQPSFSGKPPHIRLGGNTQDYMIYSSSQNEWAHVHNSNAQGEGSIKWDSMLIGPRFFEAANRFPTGTPVTWGLNLAYDDDDAIDQVVTMAQQILDRCTNLDIVAFEIGNEPDLYYTSSEFRNSTWSGEVYTDQWLSRASAIYQQVLEPAGLRQDFFEPGTTSHTSGTTFGISDLVSYGITDKTNGSSYVAVWNQHDYTYFTTIATYVLTIENVLNFATIEGQLQNQAEDQITASENTAYGYALREMGWVGPIGAQNVSDTFGGALYTLNFLLYAASLNMTGVQFHMTAESYTAAWQPVEIDGVAPYPRPLYYGHAAFNQIIGPTCTAQVSQYSLSSVPSGYDSYLRAYTIYQAGSLASIAVINAKMANVSESDKTNLTVTISLPTSLAGKTVHLARLTNDGVDAKYNSTWNGISYEESGDGTPTQVSDDDETVTVGSDGSLSITVRDSQAVVANIGSKIGTSTADKTACASMAAKSAGTNSNTSSGSSSSASATSKPGNDGTSTTNTGASSQSSGSSGEANSGNAAGSMTLASPDVLATLLLPCLSLMAGLIIF